MKKMVVLIMAIGLCMASSGMAALVNGDFDAGTPGGWHAPTGWDGYWDMNGMGNWIHNDSPTSGDPLSAAQEYQGVYAMAIWGTDNGAGGSAGIWQDFAMSPGDVVTAFFEIMEDDNEPTTVDYGFGVRIEFYDAGASMISDVVAVEDTGDALNGLYGTWASYAGPVLAPAGTVTGRYVVFASQAGTGIHGGKAHFENCDFASGNTTGKIGGFDPADGSTQSTTLTTVSWVNPDLGKYIAVDFAREGDPNQVALAKQAITGWAGAATIPITLVDGNYYRYTVKIYASSGAATPETEDVIGFFVGNLPPTVTADDFYVNTSPVNKIAVTLIANVVDDGKILDPPEYLWEVTSYPKDSIALDWGNLVADPNTLKNPKIIFEGTGNWDFLVTVNDGEFTATATAHVGVFEYQDFCAAALADPADEVLIGDFNLDCKSDILDFAIFAQMFADCTSDKLNGISPDCP